MKFIPGLVSLLLVTLFIPANGAVVSPKPAGPLVSDLQHYVDDHVVAGAVMLVADRNKIFALEALGESDLAAHRRLETDDLFWIASMTKSVTAAAFMMLVDEKRVSVDDPVTKYLPGFQGLKVAGKNGTPEPLASPILLRHLLSHTSGLHFLNEKDRQRIDSVPLEISVEHDLLEPLLFQPGTKYTYSNEGIDMIGLIVEIVSGMPYERFLQERLFTPLGMNDTTFFPNAVQLQRLAKNYESTSDKTGLVEKPIHYLTYPFDGSDRYPAPGGGLFSTARDVLQFCRMLEAEGTLNGKRYLSRESIKQMTSKQTGPLVDAAYGFGLGVSADGRSFGHGGALKTNMTVDHGQIRIFLVQHTGAWASGDPSKDFDRVAQRLFNPSANSTPTSSAAEVGTLPPR